VQVVLGSLIIGQMYATQLESFDPPVLLTIAGHLWLAAITGWGCFGAAVKDAPADDRMLEFVLAVLLGSFVCSFAWVILAPIVFAMFPWEYPMAIVAAVLIRFWPRPASSNAAELGELSTSIQSAGH
jgi:hypothetical protein